MPESFNIRHRFGYRTLALCASKSGIRQRSGSDLRLALDNRALAGGEVTVHLGDTLEDGDAGQ